MQIINVNKLKTNVMPQNLERQLIGIPSLERTRISDFSRLNQITETSGLITKLNQLYKAQGLRPKKYQFERGRIVGSLRVPGPHENYITRSN